MSAGSGAQWVKHSPTDLAVRGLIPAAGVCRVLLHQFSQHPGLEVIKLFSCSTQLSMNFFLLINVKMSRKNSILGLF